MLSDRLDSRVCTVPNGTGPGGFVWLLPMRCPYGTGCGGLAFVLVSAMAIVLASVALASPLGAMAG